MRVLFNGRTSASQADDVGSIPITRSNPQNHRSDCQNWDAMRSVVTTILFALLILFSLGGCETMKGLGKDIETLGDKIQKSAD